MTGDETRGETEADLPLGHRYSGNLCGGFGGETKCMTWVGFGKQCGKSPFEHERHPELDAALAPVAEPADVEARTFLYPGPLREVISEVLSSQRIETTVDDVEMLADSIEKSEWLRDQVEKAFLAGSEDAFAFDRNLFRQMRAERARRDEKRDREARRCPRCGSGSPSFVHSACDQEAHPWHASVTTPCVQPNECYRLCDAPPGERDRARDAEVRRVVEGVRAVLDDIERDMNTWGGCSHEWTDVDRLRAALGPLAEIEEGSP